MIKVILFEDEPAALKRIKRLINEVKPDYQIVGDADSVQEGLNLLEQNHFDLIISDIQLSDGLSFEILKHLNKTIPVIFITAYNQYAIEAFDFNGIQYLLKPIEKDKLLKALNHYESQKIDNNKISELLKHLEKTVPKTKRFLSKVGNKTQIIESNKIAYLFIDNGIVKIITSDNEKYSLDYTIEQLTKELDSSLFFQINRQMIVNIKAIKEIYSYSSNRLKIVLSPPFQGESIVSKEKTPLFKDWLANK